ncbi:helix-turn-helix transcriptional regulator [Roseovarius aestuarii]|nr:helix-turn-helix transcriptional regulator [Roseovarius aestuarii]
MSILKVSIKQIRAARALLGWSQNDHAERSGVSLPTIKRLESAGGELGGLQSTSDKLLDALADAGAIFIQENGEGPGVRLRKKSVGTG